MFNFFRRSKKDEGNRRNRSKDNKDTSDNQQADEKKKMCKNNQPSAPELAPETLATALPKNVVNATKTSSEVIPLNENFDLDPKMCDAFSEPKQIERKSAGVKPCGHGTIAITPWVPPISAKRDNISTPPSSPDVQTKKLSKRPSIDSQRSSEDVKKVEETVTASMKLHVNLPNGLTNKETVECESPSEQTKKNLINQEAKFQSQLNDLSKELSVRDAEASRLRFQMDELQRDVFAKAAGMDRLQTELNAANKETEIVRQKIKHLDNELEAYKRRNTELNNELQTNSESYTNHEKETAAKIEELENVVKGLREKITSLEKQISELKEEKGQLEIRYTELQAERAEEHRKLEETIENATKQKQEIEQKWKEDFEKLRTVNILKEQQLLDDFEWKLREVQQACKKRLDEKDKSIEARLQEVDKDAKQKMRDVEKMLSEVETLKSYELEVEKLRGVTAEQTKAIATMKEQQEQMEDAERNLKNETKRLLNLIEIEKENLQHIQRLHRQELLDKERTLKDTLNQKRTEIAMYWEERLLHECGRLKSELEQIHNEEKYLAMENVRKEKEQEFQQRQKEWEGKLRECLKEISDLRTSLTEKDEYYHEELNQMRSNTDRDIMELRRLMDKIDMAHHDNYEKLVQEHENELEIINSEHQIKLKEVENHWHNQVTTLRATLELVKDQMEKESQQKVESLIQQHRLELDSQWENLIHQKAEAIKLVEDEYVSKYKTLEERFYTQNKSHSAREVELLKSLDTLKNELQSKESTIEDLQNNVDTLEGGVQVLNEEIAQQGENLVKSKREADQKIRGLHEGLAKLLEERDKERDTFRQKLMSTQKQSQETIEHLQKKCNCLTKLFEEVRQRYERRESRQEDINIISDLRQVIAEQEKDLACINEEKRYFQMRLMQLERHLESHTSADDEEYEDAQSPKPENQLQPIYSQNGPISIPPTIPECDDIED